MTTLKKLLKTLISFPSISPSDAGCQEFMINYLESLGFTCQRFNKSPVTNFFAHLGTARPSLVFAGHTDVVPVDASWHTDPFVLHEKNGILYGRGTADMKGGLAAMLVAATRLVTSQQTLKGSLGFLITSGEEGENYDCGTPYVMTKLQKQDLIPDYCIIGEPSSHRQLGDTIKIGRRGSLTAKVHVKGTAGHVAYPQNAKNALHISLPALQELITTHWDYGNKNFPPTSLQITHIKAGSNANNVIPGELEVHFNVRYSTEQTASILQQKIQDCFARHNLDTTIQWQMNGNPFLTQHGTLIKHCQQIIQDEIGITTELSTSGGTSDGRFIAPYGVEVIELGPINASIHQANENVTLASLEKLAELYYLLCEKILT